MRISMKEILDGHGGILAGAITGRKVLAKLMEMIGTEPKSPELLYIDFNGIEVATASFLREAILAFRDTVRHQRSNFYPVIANAGDLIIGELEVLLAARGDVLMLCTLDDRGEVQGKRLVGDLDAKQRITFDLVQERGETDAAELMRDYGESEKTTVQTAWNNRLTSLANLGLVVELSRGRGKRYRPLFAGG